MDAKLDHPRSSRRRYRMASRRSGIARQVWVTRYGPESPASAGDGPRGHRSKPGYGSPGTALSWEDGVSPDDAAIRSVELVETNPYGERPSVSTSSTGGSTQAVPNGLSIT